MGLYLGMAKYSGGAQQHFEMLSLEIRLSLKTRQRFLEEEKLTVLYTCVVLASESLETCIYHHNLCNVNHGPFLMYCLSFFLPFFSPVSFTWVTSIQYYNWIVIPEQTIYNDDCSNKDTHLILSTILLLVISTEINLCFVNHMIWQHWSNFKEICRDVTFLRLGLGLY